MENKKAMMIPHWIIYMIILLVGFVILLLVYYELRPTEEIDRQVCHESIILRATLYSEKPFFRDVTDTVPLKCQTEKICLKDSLFGGECREFKDLKPEEKKKISTIRVSDDEAIKKEVAEALVNCWAMIGEGKIEFFRVEDFKDKKCMVCSIIDFEDKIDNKNIDGFGSYLTKTNIPGGNIKYIEFLAGKRYHEEDLTKSSDFSDVIDTSKEYAVVYSLYQKGWFDKEENNKNTLIAYVGAATILVSTIITGPIGAVVLIGGKLVATTGVFLMFTESSGGDFYHSMSLVPYTPEKIRELKCDSFENIP